MTADHEKHQRHMQNAKPSQILAHGSTIIKPNLKKTQCPYGLVMFEFAALIEKSKIDVFLWNGQCYAEQNDLLIIKAVLIN